MIIKLPSSGEFVNLDNLVYTENLSIVFISGVGKLSLRMDNEDMDYLRAILTRVHEQSLIALGLGGDINGYGDAAEEAVIHRLELLAQSDPTDADPRDLDGEVPF